MTYIIGEIGQNHNGSVDIAKLIIDVVARKLKQHRQRYKNPAANVFPHNLPIFRWRLTAIRG